LNISQYWWCVRTLRQAYKSKLITGLPASAVAAQARLESDFGFREPKDLYTGKRSYNLFGVKAIVKDGIGIAVGNNGWVQDLTQEWNPVTKKKEFIIANFRAYNSYADSFTDHNRILRVSKDDDGLQRYRKALEHLDDAEAFITEVWKAGYASDPNYLKNIIPIIRQLNKIPIWVLKL
jgi:flagellar protein FlgJ